jgi:hypothetical protein
MDVSSCIGVGDCISNGLRNIIRIKLRNMRWTEHVAQIGEIRSAYKLFLGKPERKRPLGRPKLT